MRKRPMDTNLKAQMSPSLALLTLNKLTPPFHEVIIVNENIEKINFDEENLDLVGITVTVDVLNRASDISKRFRERGVTVVAGGIHITANPDKHMDQFDAICVGMAERVWRKILEDKINNNLKKVYKDMENFKGNEICSPDYNSYNNNYLYTDVISTSRGCPHKCDFCYNSCDAIKYINRPIEDVISDIKSLNSTHIMFVDDNFIGNLKWTYDFLLQIKDLGLKWNAAVTTKIYHHLDLLDLMAETGCQSLFIGFESINKDSIKSVHKHNCIEEYSSLIKELHKRGIAVNASMVFGLPDDDMSIFEESVNFLIEHKVESLTSHILTPYPGTVLYDDCLKKNMIKDFDLSKYNTAHVVFKHDKMTDDELYKGYLKVYKKFYSFRNILKRLPEDKRAWKPYLLFNLLYRKFGKLTELITKIIPMNFIGNFAMKIAYDKRELSSSRDYEKNYRNTIKNALS